MYTITYISIDFYMYIILKFPELRTPPYKGRIIRLSVREGFHCIQILIDAYIVYYQCMIHVIESKI